MLTRGAWRLALPVGANLQRQENSCLAMYSSNNNSPSHAFTVVTELSSVANDEMKPILKKKDSEESMDLHHQNHVNGEHQQGCRVPQSILKQPKRGSFDGKSQIHPILKRNSLRDDSPSPLTSPLNQVQPQIHPILKKSSSEEKYHYYREETIAPRPILKKRFSVEETSHAEKVPVEVKPILKRNRGESKSESDVVPRPIPLIRPIGKNKSEASSPEGSRVITQVRQCDFTFLFVIALMIKSIVN